VPNYESNHQSAGSNSVKIKSHVVISSAMQVIG
jgi:hypothetical protein